MHYRSIPAQLTLAVLTVGATSVLAADETKPAAKPSASAQATAPKGAPAKAAPKAKEPKPVDINTASVEQLAEVPGLDKAHAMKIVSNRPYPTRAWLVTKGILSETKYAEVKDQLVATPNTSPRAPSKK